MRKLTTSVKTSIVAGFVLILISSLSFAEGFVASSSERFNLQVGESEVQLRSYDAFDELDDLAGVQSYSVSVNGGSFENIEPNPDFGGAYKRKQSFSTLNELEAVRPQGGTYVHRIEIDNNFTDVTIQAPNVDYLSAIPINPIFTFSGVTGVWAPNPYSPDGGSAFYFDPTGVTSFTVTMNAYALLAGDSGVAGEHFVSELLMRLDSGDPDSDFEAVGLGFHEQGDPTSELTLTFTQGVPPDGGEGSGDLEFGFSAGDSYEFEGEFVNIFGLAESDALDDVYHAFIFQTVTNMTFVASEVPEPSAYALLVGLSAIGLALFRRHRRIR